MRALAAASLISMLAASAQAQEPPSRVRVLRPGCAGPVAWSALEDALRVELRSMGSDLDDGDTVEVPARLALDARCDAAATRITVTLVHAPSGRSITEQIELGNEGDRVRVLAVGLSELVRSRWAALLSDPEPAPAPPPALDRDALRAEIDRALAERAPPPQRPAPSPPPPPAPIAAPPGTFFDLALAVSAYPAATHAAGELRAGASVPLFGLARIALELTAGGGWAGDPLGDVALYGAGLGASLRLAHATADLVVEAGPRIDVGWTHAEGVPASDAVRGSGLDALHLAAGLDARLRVPMRGGLWLLTACEIGASLVGIDARADDRRVTAQTGPRLAFAIGLSWS
jgi:hypothetical protein